jgi:hypothetical protein
MSSRLGRGSQDGPRRRETIHGHAHPAVVKAVQDQAARGTAFTLPTESEVALAETICERADGRGEFALALAPIAPGATRTRVEIGPPRL